MARLSVLQSGVRLHEGILGVAAKESIRTGTVQGIGGVSSLTLSYYDMRSKKYEEHVINEFMEVTSLLGNVTLKDGKPFVHVHGNFGRRDLTVIGGHVSNAVIHPFLEVSITKTTNTALRKLDEKTGLNSIYKY